MNNKSFELFLGASSENNKAFVFCVFSENFFWTPSENSFFLFSEGVQKYTKVFKKTNFNY